MVASAEPGSWASSGGHDHKMWKSEVIRDPETDKHKKQEEQFVTAS